MMSRVGGTDMLALIDKDLHDFVSRMERKRKGVNEVVVMSHDDMLDYLCDNVDLVEFGGGNSGKKITEKEYMVTVSDKVIDKVDELSYGICNHNNFLYMYNGKFWKRMDQPFLERFLGKSAHKMGVDAITSKYYQFRDGLYRQMVATTDIMVRDRDDVVRINLENGTLEVEGEKIRFREHRMEDFMTYELPFEYDKSAECPLFDKYLDEVLPNKQLQKIIAEYFGYLFVSNRVLKLEKALILYGTGANGKSVIFEVLNGLLGGNENVCSYSLESLTDSKGYSRAMLDNKLVNYASEINGKMDVALFKQLVSGEPVDARLPYGVPFTLKNYAKLVFNCNELPKSVEHTEAFFRRFLIVPFQVTIPKEKQDKQLAQKIIDNELSGVLNWVLEGLERLLKQRDFSDSEVVDNALEKYLLDSDSVAFFVKEMGYRVSEDGQKKMNDLFGEYKKFCLSYGNQNVSYRTFCARLKNLGINIRRKSFGLVLNIVKSEKI